MTPPTKVPSLTARYTDTAPTAGRMRDESTLGTGKRTECMGRATSSTKTVAPTEEVSLKERNREMAVLSGQMGDATEATIYKT